MLTFGKDGWVRYEDEGVPGAIYVRINQDLQAITLHIDREGWPILAAELRALPLAKIRSLAADGPAEERPTNDAVVSTVSQVSKALEAAFATARGTEQKWGVDSSARLTAQSPKAGLTDDFLAEVATAYRAAVARGKRPNRALSEQSGYPVRTVERWVYLARKKGALAPTKPGSIG
jgi:hypothetical protein